MIYSKPICKLICRLTVEGYCLRQLGRIKGLPSKATLMRWLNDPRKIAFKDDYRRAKETQHLFLCDELFYEVECGVNYRSLGREAGRISKLHLKKHAKPRTQLEALYEALHREKAKRLEAEQIKN
jgi:hypothetical protein